MPLKQFLNLLACYICIQFLLLLYGIFSKFLFQFTIQFFGVANLHLQLQLNKIKLAKQTVVVRLLVKTFPKKHQTTVKYEKNKYEKK